MAKEPTFSSEAELVAAFCSVVEAHNANPNRSAGAWAIYHETADWDVLLVAEDGYQLGVEAKLSLNAKVLEQSLPGRYAESHGPDFRAVLVPADSLQQHVALLAEHLGITVIALAKGWEGRFDCSPRNLPDEGARWNDGRWHSWLPSKRCALPDYLPDVHGGKSAPVKLTDWKVRAIKLVVLLERRGVVTRADMRALGLSESRWTAAYHGFLAADPLKGGYVRCDRTPDFRAQHPANCAQIEADFDIWAPPNLLAPALFAEVST